MKRSEALRDLTSTGHGRLRKLITSGASSPEFPTTVTEEVPTGMVFHLLF